MADKKITALTESTSLSTDDLFHVVDSPASSPSNKKITVTNVFNKIPSYLGINSVETISAGTGQTITPTKGIYLLNGTAALTATLANGAQTGQIVTLVCIDATSGPVITVTNTKGSMSTITFDAVGETATLLYINSTHHWTVIATSTSAGNIATILQ